MRIRFHTDSAIGLALLIAGLLLVASLALNGHAIAALLPHWRRVSELEVVTAYSVAGWLFLFVGSLMLAPAKWFDWLEKPHNPHRH